MQLGDQVTAADVPAVTHSLQSVVDFDVLIAATIEHPGSNMQ